MSDALGSVVGLVDSTGSVPTRYVYTPFGAPRTAQTANANTFTFTGREDDGTGLQYFRARYYSAALQRFVSEDPVEGADRQGNLYAYVGNAPTEFTDPMGENPYVAACGAGASIGIGANAVEAMLGARKFTWRSALRSGVEGCVAQVVLGGPIRPKPAEGFRSFAAFKRARGQAGPGQQWHHVVEQTPGNVTRFGSRVIHHHSNIVRIDAGIHRKVSGYYSSKQPFTGGLTVREWLSGQSLADQIRFGKDVMKRFGGP